MASSVARLPRTTFPGQPLRRGRPDTKPYEYDASKQDEFAALTSIDLCVAPVLDLAEALDDPHQRARQMVVEVEDPRVGMVREVGIGPKFSEPLGRVRSIAPLAEQHTDDVLGTLGFDADRIAALRERAVVG